MVNLTLQLFSGLESTPLCEGRCCYRQKKTQWEILADFVASLLSVVCSPAMLALHNRGLAHSVIAAAAVASHNVKHAWVLAWVASRFAAMQLLCFAFQSFRHRSAVFLDKVLHKERSL